MSIFTRIKDAIFGGAHRAGDSAKRSGTSPSQSHPPARPTTVPASGTRDIPANPANAAWAHVDIEEVLSGMADKNPQKLNWRTSIVDLMKLLGIDSSLENRRELARELGFTGDSSDSAAMNVWLHKRVMQELEKNGGKVPASLRD